MKHIIDYYENYKEEDRLTTNNARRIEFITTIRAFDEVFPLEGKILDCAAGTGIYSFHYAKKGYEVTATDLTPKYIDYINQKQEQFISSGNPELSKHYHHITAKVNNAVDLNCFDDGSFDIVLLMGPFYHLTDQRLREQCLRECTRVLKKGGFLAISYISRFSVFPAVVTSDSKYLNKDLAQTLITTGTITHEDPNCFWTDNYFPKPEEMEEMFNNNRLQITDHLATDGISGLLKNTVDTWNPEQFKIWCDYHYSVCREKSILGASNHGLIIGRK